ncbi:MAG: histidine triad nucleotide-binding protein [Syntrophales bacterium]|nr:histidine triad nucleotide-binding protein [Syntrophales bacterium]
MEDCIFCKIVNGLMPCSKVYEDEKTVAFDDIHPVAPVHVLVVPKQHIPTILDVGAEEMDYLSAMVAAVQEVARIKGIDQRGFKTVINCNEEGGQLIYHLHMHVLSGKRLSLKDKLV